MQYVQQIATRQAVPTQAAFRKFPDLERTT